MFILFGITMQDLHIELPEYQMKYLEKNNYLKSHVIRDELDAFILEDGGDPDEWKAKYGE